MKPKPRNRRKTERIIALKPTRIRLKGHPLELSDISSEGIGVILEKEGPRFFIGERIDNIPLPLQGGTIDLPGMVSHISITAAHTVLGIRFLLGEGDFNAVNRFKKERAL